MVFVPGTVAVGALFFHPPLVILHHRDRDNARGNGNDGIADQHHNSRKEFSHGGDGRDVSVANGGHGDDCPIDAVRDVVELRIGLRAFDHIHERSDGGHQNDNEEKEYGNLLAAFAQGRQQKFTFNKEIEQLEDAKYPYQTKGADNEQVACSGKEQTDVERQRSKQVDDAEEAENVLFRLGRTENARSILEGEEACENEFGDNKRSRKAFWKSLQAFQNDQ